LHLKSHPSPNPRFSPLLLLHGATFGAALFDLPKSGDSLMAAIAGDGRSVYALDVRGYGNSGGGRVLEEAPDRNPPFADVDEAVEDIDTAVEAICVRHHVEKLDVIGFSWGSITAARYAGARPDRVARLALYAPIYADVRPIWRAISRATSRYSALRRAAG
jgi:pimeloyl-ACP methyl ester carboxylesterase